MSQAQGRSRGTSARFFDGLSVVALAIAPYVNALSCGFAYDDNLAILSNKVVREGTLFQVLSGAYWGTIAPAARSHGYRPLTVASFWTQWQISGDAPWSWHALNILLHALCAWLVWATAARLGFSRLASWFAAALFAVHALHTEAVTSVVGRAELFATIGVLGALALHSEGRYRWAALMFALGVLGKETALAFPLLVAAEDFASGRLRQRARVYLLYGAVVVGFFGLRWSVVDHLFPTFVASRLDNPLACAPTLERVWAGLAMFGRFVGLLIAPIQLSADYGFGAIALPVPVFSLWPWVGVLVLAGAGFGLVAGLRRLSPGLVVPLAVMLVALVPVSNIFFPIHTIFGERLAYLGSVGFCLAAALGVSAAVARNKPLSLAAMGVVLLLHCVRTWERNPDWSDNVSLFAAAHEVTPTSARVQNNYGNVLLSRDDVEGALASYRAASKTLPTYPDPWINQANLLRELGRMEEARIAATHADEAVAAARLSAEHTDECTSAW